MLLRLGLSWWILEELQQKQKLCSMVLHRVEWVSLDIPMADFISGGMTATNSIQQLIFSGLPTGTFDFYIDNVYFYKIPPTSPTTAAPDPTEAQADVINMYSNVYTQDVNVSSWRSDWSTSTLTDIQVAGNDTKEYIDADFVGVEFYAPDAVDASGMAFFHVDVWTPNATTFRVKLVDLGGTATEAEIVFDGIAQGRMGFFRYSYGRFYKRRNECNKLYPTANILWFTYRYIRFLY